MCHDSGTSYYPWPTFIQLMQSLGRHVGERVMMVLNSYNGEIHAASNDGSGTPEWHHSGDCDAHPTTRVLEDAQYICENAIDVSVSRNGVEAAAQKISTRMRKKHYSPSTWSSHELHPSSEDGERTVDFIFTMDLLNFSFWSERPNDERFAISYGGRVWTGYWSLVAALRRALEECIPITQPAFWYDKGRCTDAVIRHVFRSETAEEIPLLNDRISCLREAGRVLCEDYDGRFVNFLSEARQSATRLVEHLVSHFSCFRDEALLKGKRVRLLKRAQILVADLWACFEGKGFGKFHDIDSITMFADYRIPQMLHALGCLVYSPALERHVRQQRLIESSSRWEIELRGSCIWTVELIVRFIKAAHRDQEINAILVDFFLYDTIKEQEAAGHENAMIPHHRTRSIWY